MTKRQRAALKLAMEYLKRAEKEAYNDRDMAFKQRARFSQSELLRVSQRYADITAALQAIEEMIRGEQGVMDI